MLLSLESLSSPRHSSEPKSFLHPIMEPPSTHRLSLKLLSFLRSSLELQISFNPNQEGAGKGRRHNALGAKLIHHRLSRTETIGQFIWKLASLRLRRRGTSSHRGVAASLAASRWIRPCVQPLVFFSKLANTGIPSTLWDILFATFGEKLI